MIKLTKIIIVNLILFILMMSIAVFLRWYAGYNILHRSEDNAFCLAISFILSFTLSSFLTMLCNYYYL